MVQGIGKNIAEGIVIIVVIMVVLAVMIAVPIVGLSYEYAARSAANVPFWSVLTYFYAGLLSASGGGFIWLLRKIF